MRIGTLLLGLVLVAETACTRPTPGYCGDGRGGFDSAKCGPGLTCNRFTLLCDRPDGAVVVVVDGGKDVTPSDARDGGADTGGGTDAIGGADAPGFVTCGDGGTCATGTCVDGVCCQNTACDRCKSCAVPGSEGTCTPLPVYMDDPNASCVGDRTCDGFGGCSLKLGKACVNATDCASGVCVDGVCCDQACNEICRSCNQLSSPGTCLPVGGVEDTNSTPACSGTQICAPVSQGTPACKLKDGQTCTESMQCANGTCFTSYRDADMDGFGANAATRRCGQAPAAGYLTTPGDCCDSDPASHPNRVTPSSTPNACNSFDLDCDGTAERNPMTQPCGCQIVGTGMVCVACL